MPRNKILPPVSFVTDLSNSGNNLIQQLFARKSQNEKGVSTVSFSERLRSQPVESPLDRSAKTTVAKTAVQNRREIDQPDRLELPERKIPENRKTKTASSGQSKTEDQQSTALASAVSTTDTASTDEQKNDRFDLTGQSAQKRSQRNDSVESGQRVERETETEQTSETQLEDAGLDNDSQTGEIPAALLKHVVQSTKQNGELDQTGENEGFVENENSQAPVISNELANALQNQNLLQPEQSQDQQEQDVARSEDESAEKKNPLSPATDSQEQNDLSEKQVSAPSDADSIGQNEAAQGQVANESILEGQLPNDQAAEESKSEQGTDLKGETESAGNSEGEKQSPGEIGQERSREVSQQQQAREPGQEKSENEARENSQNKPNDSLAGEQILQQVTDANAAKDSGSSDEQKEFSVQQQGVSDTQKKSETQNRERETETAAVVGKSDSETGDATENQSRESPRQESTASEIPAHVAQQYQQDTLQGHPSLKQSSNGNATRTTETASVEKLIETAGPVKAGESAEATQTQKGVQAEPVSTVTTNSARSSVETPAALQSRPVLDLTRSDMSQKLSSFIQQASESGRVMRIRLDPPELGSMQIEVGRVNGQLVARIEVDNPHARALVFEQLQLLRESLQQQGLRIDRLEVELNENLSREFTSDQSGNQKSEEQQRFAEEREFASENKRQAEQDEHRNEEKTPDSAPRQVVGVSEIDVQI